MTGFLRSIRVGGFWFLSLFAILFGTKVILIQIAKESNYELAGLRASILVLVDQAILMLSLSLILASTLLVYWLAFVAISWLIRSTANQSLLSGTSIGNRFVAAVLVALMFNDLVTHLFQLSGQIAISMFDQVWGGLASVLQSGLVCISNSSGRIESGTAFSACTINLFGDAGRTVYAVAQQVFGRNALTGINPVQLLFAVGAFFVLSRSAAMLRLDMDKRTKFWIGYVAVAAFSIYLSLGALLAVPLLSGERDGGSMPAADLRTMLVGIVDPILEERSIGENSPLSPQPNSNDIETLLASSIEGAGGQSLANLTEIGNLHSEIRNSYERAKLKRDQFISILQGHISNQLESAVVLYTVEAEVRRGEREGRRHVLDLRSWFQAVVEEGLSQIRLCEQQLVGLENVRSRVDELVRETVADGNASRIAAVVEQLGVIVWDVNRDSLRAGQSCEVVNNFMGSPPRRLDYGSFLGVVGAASSWLLTTESMQVTLLTGLIGFGLLGALVAFFVRTPEKVKEANEYDIAVLIFTGFCAAIVMYVASYGGLAIASVSSDDPNPYVVFFACLVGAVYSGDIFTRAKEVMFK